MLEHFEGLTSTLPSRPFAQLSDALLDTQVSSHVYQERGLRFPAFLRRNKPVDWCSQQLVHKAHNKTEILAQNNHNKPHLAFFTHEVVGRRMYLHFLCHKSKAR